MDQNRNKHVFSKSGSITLNFESLKSIKSEEIATLVFFILTGYKFRPGCNNPYFKVEEEDLAEVVTKTAITEKVQKRKDKSGEKKVKIEIHPQNHP